MHEVSAPIAENSRKIERAVLHALAEHGQAAVAQKMGTSESTVSRLKDGQIQTLSNLLAALGLKVVPANFKSMDPIKAQAMVTLYSAAMERISNPAELLWGDEN